MISIGVTGFGSGSAASAGAMAGLLFLACAKPPDTYWTRESASEKDFGRASRWCAGVAQDAAGSMGTTKCTTTTAYGGASYCQETDPNDFDNVARKKVKLQRTYNQCLEQRGWQANYEGEGFKGQY